MMAGQGGIFTFALSSPRGCFEGPGQPSPGSKIPAYNLDTYQWRPDALFSPDTLTRPKGCRSKVRIEARTAVRVVWSLCRRAAERSDAIKFYSGDTPELVE